MVLRGAFVYLNHLAAALALLQSLDIARLAFLLGLLVLRQQQTREEREQQQRQLRQHNTVVIQQQKQQDTV